MVNITLLGTSGLIPLPDRALTSALLTCNGKSILFDCGEGTQTAAMRVHCSLINIDIIALTHYHGDHIFGLPGLLQTMFSLGRVKPLYITGPSGLEENMKPIIMLTGKLSFIIFFFHLGGTNQVSEYIADFPKNIRLSAFSTKHRVSSCGYLFELQRGRQFIPDKAKEVDVPVNMWKKIQHGESITRGDMMVTPEMVLGEQRTGIKFVFTGDTSPCPSLIDAAKEADLMICEATYGDDNQKDIAIERGHIRKLISFRPTADIFSQFLYHSSVAGTVSAFALVVKMLPY